MELMKDWAGFAAIALALLSSVHSWLTSRSQVNSEHLKRVDGNLKDHDRRIQKVESEIEHLPSKDSLHQLDLAMKDLQGDVKQMSANLESVTRTSHRVERFLMGDK